jgi:hypothetical protein
MKELQYQLFGSPEPSPRGRRGRKPTSSYRKRKQQQQIKEIATRTPSIGQQLRLPGTFKSRERPREERRYSNGNGRERLG